MHHVRLLLVLAGLGVLVTPTLADPLDLSRRIDQRIQAVLDANKVRPARRADDAEFLRRVYLDIAGRIPPASEVYEFLASQDPDKRGKVIDKLLGSNGYVNNFAATWRSILIPASTNPQAAFQGGQVENWLREQFREGVPYDVMARDLITLPIGGAPGAGQRPVFQQSTNARAYYLSNEFRPENLASGFSRVFVGVKMECAQCHNHPFAHWTREQFWQQAAFFARIQPVETNGMVFNGTEADTGHEITIPGKDKKVSARFLDGTEAKVGAGDNPRELFASWLTDKNNPYFARATANRMWAQFFGIGLVEPVDEMFDENNTPSHPELLDELGQAFVESGYDLKFLVRAICNSEAYQRTSARTDPAQSDPTLFAHMALKGLTAGQLFDSLCQATGYRDGQGNQFQQQVFVAGQGSPRAEFLAKFGNSVDKKTEVQTSILQALAMMNGRFIADVTSIERSNTLAAVIEAPFLETRDRLQTLFISVLSRPMRPEEEAKLLRYVESGGASRDSRKALADVFWVLLNSSEFSLNH